MAFDRELDDIFNMGPVTDEDPNPVHSVEEDGPDVDELQKKLAAAEARAAKAEAERNAYNERIARLEGRFEEQNRHQPQQPQVELPTDEAGWRYARMVAQYNAQQNPDLQGAAQQIERMYTDWQKEQVVNRERKQERKFQATRLLDRYFPEGEEDLAFVRDLAMSKLEAGEDFDVVEENYLKPLKTRLTAQAREAADDDSRQEMARRSAIEGDSRPAQEPKEKKPDPKRDINASVANLFRQRAPAFTKIFGK